VAERCGADAGALGPCVSLIVPVLNEAPLITAALLRLQPLRAANVEVIVVDGGSADTSVALAVPLADRVLCVPKGRASQMNAGAAVALAPILLFLHIDTSLPEHACEALSGALMQTSRAWGRFDVVISGQPRMLRVVATLMNLRSRLTGIATGDQAIFVRREVFYAVGGFPLQLLMEDIALSRLLLRHSAPVCLPQRVLTSGRRWIEGGLWRTVILMWRLRLLYWLGVSPDKLARHYR